MNFDLSEEHELLQETVRQMLANECPPTRVREIFDGETGHDEGYAEEEQQVRELLEREAKDSQGAHLRAYLGEWERLRTLIREGRS